MKENGERNSVKEIAWENRLCLTLQHGRVSVGIRVISAHIVLGAYIILKHACNYKCYLLALSSSISHSGLGINKGQIIGVSQLSKTVH